MPSPSVTFAFILATIYGVLFHLLVGGDVRRLALYLLAGWLGFALGHILGVMLGVNILRVGSLRTLSATVGGWTALIAARLFLVRPTRSKRI
jgi:hypothetical protein